MHAKLAADRLWMRAHRRTGTLRLRQGEPKGRYLGYEEPRDGVLVSHV
jgi:hypothetical protein